MVIDFVLINYHCGKDVGRILREIERTFPWEHTVTVIDNSHDNRGFAAAANLGASFGRGEFIAFLNPDLHLAPDWATSTLRAFAHDENLVICGPRLADGLPWPRKTLETNGIHNWVCGACYFVRRDFFESRGGFDERFFFTYEETDLIRQAETLGYRALAVDTERPIVAHVRHNTRFHDEQLTRSSMLYHLKWDSCESA